MSKGSHLKSENNPLMLRKDHNILKRRWSVILQLIIGFARCFTNDLALIGSLVYVQMQTL